MRALPGKRTGAVAAPSAGPSVHSGRRVRPPIPPFDRPRGPSMTVWVVLVAILIAIVIAWAGLTALRATSGVGARREAVEPEDVDELDVRLVCRECGTEFRVTRIGELQIPRHCGEPMEVVRGPAEG